jgi:hypothetical protein
MNARNLGQPQEGEYPPFAAPYMAQLPKPFTVERLRESFAESKALLQALPGPDAAQLRTAPGKWTVAQIIGHISDCERILSYRLLRIARGDTTELPGFDQDAYVAAAPHASWTLDQLVEDWALVRAATISLLDGLPENAWMREGFASGHRVTVRALAGFILGHERHHTQMLRRHFLESA